MIYEKEDLAEIKELMDYYKEQIQEASGAGKSTIPHQERYLHSAIKYIGILQQEEKKALDSENRKLDSMLVNMTQSRIPDIPEITRCRKNIEQSMQMLDEYSSALEKFKEERASLPLMRTKSR